MNKTKRQAAKRSLRRQLRACSTLQAKRRLLLMRPRRFQQSKPYKPTKARPGYFLNEYGFEQPIPQKRDIRS